MNMNTDAAPVVRWKVIGYREAVRQAAPGEPWVPAGCCDRCGQGIRHVYRVKSTAGEVMEVGSDCAVTLKGGPELAELRRAEREYEHEMWLKSPEFARQQDERRAREAAGQARAAAAEGEHAMTLAGLRAIQASPNCSDYDKDTAKLLESRIVQGAELGDLDCWEERQRGSMSIAARQAFLPASRHVGQVGQRIELSATLEALIPVETAYGRSYVQRFRADDGAVLVWFSAGGTLGTRDVGRSVRIRGTVKAHKDYRGEPQTSLSRCKVTS